MNIYSSEREFYDSNSDSDVFFEKMCISWVKGKKKCIIPIKYVSYSAFSDVAKYIPVLAC